MSKSRPQRKSPSILLVATCWWPSTARFAQLLIHAGCEVSILCPPGHPARAVPGIRALAQNAFFPHRSISRAVDADAPDLIIPVDERAVGLLHGLSEIGSDQLRQLVERSLGPASGYCITSSRPRLLELAAHLGIAIPPSAVLPNRATLGKWLNHIPGPWVLKVDGSSSGSGVFNVETPQNAYAVLKNLQNRPWRLLVALKRLLVNRDPFWLADWLRHAPPQITAQAHVAGHPADLAMFCWNGEVRAATMAEAVTNAGKNRPTTMARLIDREDFMVAAKTLATALNLTGFYGLDFMIDDATGKAFLIELNPRPTPLANLRLDQERDLVGAAITALTGEPTFVTSDAPAGKLVAYFPNAWVSKQHDPRMATAIQDAPWDEPALLAEMLRPMWPDRQWLSSLIEFFSRRSTEHF